MILRRDRESDEDTIFEARDIEGSDGPWVELYHTYDPVTCAEHVMQMPVREFRWLVEEAGPEILKGCT